jgi:hypothetical protein
MKDNILQLPDEIGEGFFRSIEFNESDALLYSFKLKTDLVAKREKDEKEY